jgi:hypothetical protein
VGEFMIYDICIVGAGPGMIGVLEGLKSKNYKGSILVVEQGKNIDSRPLSDRLHGFGGAGAFCDMKLMIDYHTGGDLYQTKVSYDYLQAAKEFYIKNGAPNSPIFEEAIIECKQARKYGFALQPTDEIIHCGTDRAIEINKNIFNYFEDLNITYLFEIKVLNITISEEKYYKVILNDGDIYSCNKIIIATGRSHDINLSNLNIEYTNNAVDIGVRCEIDFDTSMKPWFDKFYHPKLTYITPTYQDKVRTFCSNPQGYITIEDYDNFKLVNGETFKDKKSNRTNFAILVSIPFTEPFKDGNEFARSIARTVNNLNNGKPIVQSYRDLLHGRRSTWERIIASNINNCIDNNSVCPGDLSLVIPYRYIQDIKEFINNLDRMFTGITDKMLLYGLEAKFYANKPNFINDNFEVKSNLYFCGDCSGITRGIIQATAMGIYIGEQL